MAEKACFSVRQTRSSRRQLVKRLSFDWLRVVILFLALKSFDIYAFGYFQLIAQRDQNTLVKEMAVITV
jgi:hypothetical protein